MEVVASLLHLWLSLNYYVYVCSVYCIYGQILLHLWLVDLLHLWLKAITFMVSITFMVGITFMVFITFMGDTVGCLTQTGQQQPWNHALSGIS